MNEGHDVRFLRIDVTDDSSTSEAARIVGNADGMFDILINNARIVGGDVQLPSQERIGNIRAVCETNVFAPIAVT